MYQLSPLRRIADLVPPDDSPHRPFQIMRRIPLAPRSKASSQTGSGNDDSAVGTGDVSDGDMSEAGSVRGVKKKNLTLSERQAQYEEARSRIFKDLEEKEKQKSQDMSASSSTLSLLSVDSSSAGAPSGGGSSSVGESPDDSGSVDRDRDWDSSSKDKKDYHYTASLASGNARSSRPHNPVFNGSGHPSGYYPTLYDPSAPSGPNLSQSQTNHPHYQPPHYPVYSYGPPSFMSPYPYPYPYPPPPPPNDASAGHVTMNPAPPISPNESSTSNPHEMYAMPPVSYMNPYMWSQSPHAPPNPHHPPSQAPPEYGQVPYHNSPPNHPIHSHAYGSPMPFYVPPTPVHSQSPHQPPQSRMHIPPMQPPPQPQMHPPLHTYQPQPQHPQQLFHPPPPPPPPQPQAPPASSSQSQMPPLSIRPHSLGSSPEGYIHGPNPMIVPSHTHTHPNGTKSQPPPAGYEHYMQPLPPTSAMWIPQPTFTYPQPSNNNIRRPAGKSLYDPAAEGESNQNQNHLGPRFPYRRNGGRSGPSPNVTNNQGIVASFSGEPSAATIKRPALGNNSSQPSFSMQSTSGSSSSTSTDSSTSQSSPNSSRQVVATSKHPLPARPDWAVGLKAQPTLHYSQNYPATSSQRLHPNRLPGPSDGSSPTDLPVLQSTDFPPLPLNANSNTVNSDVGSTANLRSAPGGAWAAHPATRAFLGSNTNANATTDGSPMGPLSIHANGSTTESGISQAASLQQDPSRLDEPDRTFERPGPKAGGELFNPHATAPKGTATHVVKNTKGKASPNGHCKNKAQAGGSNNHSVAPPSISNNASSDSLIKSDMTAGVMLIDRMAGLRMGNGKEDSGMDDPTVMSAA